MIPSSLTAVVITVSDSRHSGERADLSGPAIAERLTAGGFQVLDRILVPDNQPEIEAALRRQCKLARLVVTTGGTGVAPRDVTPEATRAVSSRIIEGFGEVMRSEGRKSNSMAPLSRAVAATLGGSLIVNLPGSLRGARESLEAVLPLILHALALLEGSDAQHE